MPIDPNVKFLGVTNQNIDLTERKSSKSNGYTDYFSLAEILAEVPAPTVPTLLSELTNDVGFITGNFYTADDSLTANRTVIGGGNILRFIDLDTFQVKAQAHRFENVSGNFNTLLLTNSAVFGSNNIRFGRNGIDGNAGEIYSSDVAVSLTYGGTLAQIYSNGFKVGGNGFTSPVATLQVVSPSASVLDTAFTVRGNTDTDYLFRQLGNGEWRTKVGNFACGFSDYFEIGNGSPCFLIDAPAGSLADSRYRVDGNTICRVYANASSFGFQVREYQIRDFATNYIQTIKNTLGEWLFTYDTTGLQTPETGVRAKFYGTVKTVSPSASNLDTAWAIRNNTDTADLVKVRGDGSVLIVSQPLYVDRINSYSGAILEITGPDTGFSLKNGSANQFRSNNLGFNILRINNLVIADASLNNNEVSSYIDEGANLLIFKVKYSSGVVKTTSLALI